MGQIIRRIPVPQKPKVVPQTPQKLFVIEDNNILSMTKDPRFVEIVPCLGEVGVSLDAAMKKCGRCQKKKADARAAAMTSARNCIARLPAEQRTALKKLLNAQAIRVIKTTSRGQTVQVTI